MEEYPLVITHHARQRYAERTSPHRGYCTGAGCAGCRHVADEVKRLVAARLQDEEIERRVLRGSVVRTRQERDWRGLVDIVILEDADMWFVVECSKNRNVLLTCYPSRPEDRGGRWGRWKPTQRLPEKGRNGRATRVVRKKRLEELSDAD